MMEQEAKYSVYAGEPCYQIINNKRVYRKITSVAAAASRKSSRLRKLPPNMMYAAEEAPVSKLSNAATPAALRLNGCEPRPLGVREHRPAPEKADAATSTVVRKHSTLAACLSAPVSVAGSGNTKAGAPSGLRAESAATSTPVLNLTLPKRAKHSSATPPPSPVPHEMLGCRDAEEARSESPVGRRLDERNRRDSVSALVRAASSDRAASFDVIGSGDRPAASGDIAASSGRAAPGDAISSGDRAASCDADFRVDSYAAECLVPVSVAPDVRLYRCPWCRVYFEDAGLHALHLALHDQGGGGDGDKRHPWRCSACRFEAADAYSFAAHVLVAADHLPWARARRTEEESVDRSTSGDRTQLPRRTESA